MVREHSLVGTVTQRVQVRPGNIGTAGTRHRLCCGSAAPREQANSAEQDDPQLAPEAYSTLATHIQSDSRVVQKLQRGP